ncbi:hypothetical protein COF83_31945, partial [Bacillus toyonensis]
AAEPKLSPETTVAAASAAAPALLSVLRMVVLPVRAPSSDVSGRRCDREGRSRKMRQSAAGRYTNTNMQNIASERGSVGRVSRSRTCVVQTQLSAPRVDVPPVRSRV